MKKGFIIMLAAMLLTGCAGKKAGYTRISQEEARQRMNREGVVILDVREPSEFAEGHIPGAVLLPVGTITGDTAAAVIPDFDTEVLVYCRSGNRSQTASDALAGLGYRNVYEFGGIRTWPYEIVSCPKAGDIND